MERESLTPGKLFARMSAEFRRRSGHPNCRMPMVLLAHRLTPDGPNWTLETGAQSACSKCMPMALAIAAEAAEHYDLRDPTAMPRWPANAVRPPPHQPGAGR